MMILLSLIAVGILGLSATQIRASRSGDDQKIARANARLALQIAIGKLQKHAGPDTRVTARAELVTPASGSTNPSTSRWTGVWASNPDHLADNKELTADKPIWLVSGSGEVDRSKDIATYSTVGSSSAKEITLFSEARSGSSLSSLSSAGGSSGSDHNELRVALEGVYSSPNQITGAFGYAVSDENIKAHINVTSSERSENRSLYATAVNPQLIELDGETPFLNSDWLEGDESGRYATLATMGIENKVNPEVHLENDLTAFSRSLLTDTANGGLKTDLTLALESSESNFRKFVDKTPYQELIFPASGSGGDPGGPKWEQLRNYLNDRVSSRSQVVEARPPTNEDSGFAPVVALMQWAFKVYSVPHKEGTPVQTITTADIRSYVGATFYTYVCPSLVLWNPYDVDMSVGELYFQHTFQGLNVNAGGSVLQAFPAAGRQPGDNEGAPVLRMSLAPGVIKAGSTKRFGVQGYQPYSSNAKDNKLVGVDDLLTVGGFYNEVTNSSSIWGYRNTASSLVKFSNNFWNAHSSLNQSSEFSQDTKLVSINHVGADVDLIGNGLSIRPTFIGMADLPGLGGQGATLRYGTTSPPATQPHEPTYQESMHELLLGFQYFMPFPLSDQIANPQSFINWRNKASRSFQIDMLSIGNIRSPFFTRMAASPNPGRPFSSSPIYVSGGVNNSLGQPFTTWIGGGDGTFSLGSSIDYGFGPTEYSLFEYPREEKVFRSIGELAQANLFNIEDTRNNWGQNNSPIAYTPTYAIGNSYAPILVPLDQIEVDHSPKSQGGETGFVHDYAYKLNKELWDSFFFSTYGKGASSPSSLANERYHFDATDEESIDSSTIAAHLTVEGGFNVNSASPNAWKAVLSAFRDQTVNNKKNSHTHPLTRFDQPLGSGLSESPSTDEPGAYSSFRALSDEQIGKLAQNIARFNQERCVAKGRPHLSLAEFINRSLEDGDGSNLAFANSGIIQQALDVEDKEGESINGNFEDTIATFELLNEVIVSDGSVKALTSRKLSTNVPGYLMQSDILARIGPFLTARGDTFKIRTYGDSRDKNGRILATAYCEAVVQRQTEFVDPSDLASTKDFDSLSKINRNYGRRFSLVSFRWLNENEV
ncbi:hypothetical protein AAFN60_05725 [Roseibacillus persicicus]|uniref:hypothetical protein n=1 Tax=Roseibacillus persicicus TaxID=454148 RepID=UPI00398AAF93